MGPGCAGTSWDGVRLELEVVELSPPFGPKGEGRERLPEPRGKKIVQNRLPWEEHWPPTVGPSQPQEMSKRGSQGDRCLRFLPPHEADRVQPEEARSGDQGGGSGE